jgi:hypothetical protein
MRDTLGTTQMRQRRHHAWPIQGLAMRGGQHLDRQLWYRHHVHNATPERRACAKDCRSGGHTTLSTIPVMWSPTRNSSRSRSAGVTTTAVANVWAVK